MQVPNNAAHLRDPRTFAIIGAAMEVHRYLRPGLPESAYQEALEIEFQRQNVPHRREVEIFINYKGQTLQSHFRADFVCFDEIIVELKALAKLSGLEESQIIAYLKASKMELGLLINFGAESLQYKRFANSK